MGKKGLCCLIILNLLSLPSCGKKKESVYSKKVKKETVAQVDIPFADAQVQVASDEQVQSFFDQDMDEFVAVNQDNEEMLQMTDQATQMVQDVTDEQDFSWVDNVDAQKEACKIIYFDFDEYAIRKDQQTSVEQDAVLVQKTLSKSSTEVQPTVVIEGHACHSAGDPAYNLALSEKRAKIVADQLITAGVSPDYIKIVGRGQEVPAVIEGKKVTGSREEQWPNRRVEVHIVYG